MPREGYTSISLPNELIDRIDKFIQTTKDENGKQVFSSRADLAYQATRKFLNEYKLAHIRKEAYQKESMNPLQRKKESMKP